MMLLVLVSPCPAVANKWVSIRGEGEHVFGWREAGLHRQVRVVEMQPTVRDLRVVRHGAEVLLRGMPGGCARGASSPGQAQAWSIVQGPYGDFMAQPASA